MKEHDYGEIFLLNMSLLLTPFFVRDDDRSGLIGEGKVTVYFDSRWKPACKDSCR